MSTSFLVTLSLIFLLSAAAAQSETPAFAEKRDYGLPPAKVIQVLDDGLLLYAERIDQKPGLSSMYPQPPSAILLAGYPDKLVDGEVTNYCVVEYTGTFQYQSVAGAGKTVRAFKFRRLGME